MSERTLRCRWPDRCASCCGGKSWRTLYETFELPLVPVLVAIERAGVRIDGPTLLSQSGNVDKELARRAAQIYEYSGEEFNINSPKKLSEILFDKLGMRTETIRRTTKTKAQSTSFEVLEELALAHELPRLILEWRALMKLKGTYIDALPQLVDPETGRVHTCFNQAVAATGRLSSSDPNLQNIPIRTEVGREIRRAFVAEPGNVLISADYSQIELRVLAHMSDEQTLIDAFSRNEDIHDRTAAKVFGGDEQSLARTNSAGAPRSSTTRCSTASRRSRWPRTSACRGRKRRISSTPTSRAFRTFAGSSTTCWSRRANRAWSRPCSAGDAWSPS